MIFWMPEKLQKYQLTYVYMLQIYHLTLGFKNWKLKSKSN